MQEDARACHGMLLLHVADAPSRRAQVLGCAALFGTILPFVELPFSAQVQAHSYSRDVRIPFMKVRRAHHQGSCG